MSATAYFPCSHDELKWGRKKELLGGKEIVVCGRCREEIPTVPQSLQAVADVVLAYRPKSKQPKPKKRKKAKRG